MAGGRFDNALKALVDDAPGDLCTLLLGVHVDPADIRRLPGDLPANPIEADGVFELPGRPGLLHVEFQLDARPADLHPRLLRYFQRLSERSNAPPDQHVVVLRPPGLPGRYRSGRMALHYVTHHLWEIPAADLLQLDHLYPLATLGAPEPGEDALDVVESVARRVAAIRDLDRRFDVATHAATLASITVPDPRTLEDVFRRLTRMPVDFRELPFVEAERVQARTEGRLELLGTVLYAHLGPGADDRSARIAALTAAAQHQLAADLLSLADLAALDAWLDAHG